MTESFILPRLFQNKKLICWGIVFLTLIFSPQALKAQPAQSAWPVFHHDNQRTGNSLYNGSTREFARWRFRTGASITASPVIDSNGTVYIGSWDHYFYAINNFGILKWRFKTGDIIRSSAAISKDGVIYVGSNDRKLYALSRAKDVQWTFEAGGAIVSSPAIGDDGTIYFGSSDSKVYALNPDGSLKWVFDASSSGIDSSPAIGYDDRIYIGSWDTFIYGLNKETGALEWHWPFPSWFFTPQEIADQLKNGTIPCYYGGIFASPAIAPDGSIFIANDRLNRQAPCAPKTNYYYFRITPCLSSPTVPDICGANFEMTFGDEDVYSTAAINKDASTYLGYGKSIINILPDGSKGWSYETKGQVSFSSPALSANSYVYVGSEDGYLYAFTGNGNLLWKYLTDGPILSSPAIDPGGSIIFGSDDGSVYAIGGSLCPLRLIFQGQDESLGSFRKFRDAVLKNSPKGEFFVKAYYLAADEIIALFNKNPELQHKALRISEYFLSQLSTLDSKQKLYIPKERMVEIEALISAMESEASPAFKPVIAMLKKEISEKTWINSLGIYWE